MSSSCLGDALLCVTRVCACEIFHFPWTQREMSDKTATVCPACLLYLNVCGWCQFTLSPYRQQESLTEQCGKTLLSHDLNVGYLICAKQLEILPRKMISRINCTDCASVSDSYISFCLSFHHKPDRQVKKVLAVSRKSYCSIFLSLQNMHRCTLS